MIDDRTIAPSKPAQPLLAAHGLSKRYGPVEALRDVSIDFLPGEVHGIVGENGAGKTTLMRLLAGEEQPDRGHIAFDGQRVVLSDPATARARGIAIVHQQFQLVHTMTVAENMFLGAPPTSVSLGPLSLVDHGEMARRAAQRLADFGLDHRVHDRIDELSVAEHQLVEIARAMNQNARLLILDEPTASLGAAETRELFQHVTMMRDRGAAIILIAHNLDEVMELSDRISVLRNGQLITTQDRAALDYDRLVQTIVGRELRHGYPKRDLDPGPQALHAAGCLETRSGLDRPIELRQSEILGVPTYVGAMVDDVIDALAGVKTRPGMTATIGASDITSSKLARRVAAGLCMIPGDAMAEGLIPGFSIEDNILVPNLRRFRAMGIVRRRALRDTVNTLIRELDIRPADPDAPVQSLSGGNRQKVVIAKWLASGARVLLMNDPTKAVDVGAKAEIYRLMGDVVADGGAILLVSSDLDELVGLSDRILVLRGSKLVEEFPARPISKEKLMAAVVGSREAKGAHGGDHGGGHDHVS